MSSQPRVVELKITEFSNKGAGTGQWISPNNETKWVDVPFSAPGDEVFVHLLKRKGGVYKSQALEWLHVSENRVTPRCMHFGQCGGCSWQHIAYEDQLKQKENWIYESLAPLLHKDTMRHAIIPCDPPWQYRNKMELSFSSDKAGNRYLGLILQGTRGHVFQMKECHLMNPWIIDAVHAVSAWWEASGLDAYHPGGDRGSLRTLTLREGQRTGDRMVVLTVSGNPTYALNKKQIENFVSHVRENVELSSSEQKLSIFLRIQQIAKGKPTQFYEMLLFGPDHIREILHIENKQGNIRSLEFRISPAAFFQPNTRQAEKIYSRTLQLTNIPSDALVYDLYCGTGTLGVCMASQAKQVIGIELSPESSVDAKENIKNNQLSNMTIHTGDVGMILPNVLKDNKPPHVVVVDPPRVGLDAKALDHLIKSQANQLVYISCNPATQATNLAVLIEAGYRIEAVQPVDQFPHTVHVENIVVLNKNEA